MPIQSFGIEHAHPNLKLDVFPLPGQPTKQPQASPSESDKDKDHFMAMACLASLRSKDTRKKAHKNDCTDSILTYLCVIIVGWSMPR